MRNYIYIILATVLVSAVSCSKDILPQETFGNDGMVRIAIEPEFDLQVDVRSVEVGMTDIMCWAYSGTTLLEGFPKKQTEINGGTYLYDIPQGSTYRVFFTVYPEDIQFIYSYDKYYLNGYALGGYYHTMVHETSEVTCTRNEYYISNADNWWSRSLDIKTDSDYSLGTVTLSNMQRDCKLMFNFIGMPEGETAETYVDKIHVKVGGLSLDKVLTMEDLTAETIEEETLWGKTIYTVMGYDRFGTGFKTMDIIIECTDGKVFVVNQFAYNYKRNEQQRINIDFSTQE